MALTPQERDYVKAIKSMGFTPTDDTDETDVNKWILTSTTFLQPDYNVEIHVPAPTCRELFIAIHRAGVSVGEDNKTREVKELVSSFWRMFGPQNGK